MDEIKQEEVIIKDAVTEENIVPLSDESTVPSELKEEVSQPDEAVEETPII